MKDAEKLTRRWLTECVLALDLCPFAAPVLRDDSLRIVVSGAAEHDQCRQDFLLELDAIQITDEAEISTTLLVFEQSLSEFEDYLEILDAAQQLLEQAELAEQFQLASFHPRYQFEGEPVEALSNYTNRSPLPTLHILRQAMLTRMLASYPRPDAIPDNNIARLEAMGEDAVRRLWGSLSP